MVRGVPKKVAPTRQVLIDANTLPIHVRQREQGVRVTGCCVVLDNGPCVGTPSGLEKSESIAEGSVGLHPSAMATKAKAFHI
jgi:hypothetical protein